MARYAFYLDAAACSGCKACQIACKDRNALPLGTLWRRVYEVSGGGWRAEGGAWRQDVFAYNLSIGCNHCERPICVEVCPTGAMHRRSDGVVLIDEARCVGCRYCAWACPYGAPQYLTNSGIMGKCTLCADDLELGNPPACVAACGLRALDFGSTEELERKYGEPGTTVPNPVSREPPSLSPTSPPLPDPALTAPALLLRAHPHAARAHDGGGRVANVEEVSPGGRRALREPSLVAFTVLAQLAVGLLWAWLALRWTGVASAGAPAPRLALVAAGPILLAGMLVSLLHLGRFARAPYALTNLRRSWLSREIWLSLATLVAWLVLLGLEAGGHATERLRAASAVMAGLLGLALIYAMARVYRLRTVPAWNTIRTYHAFLLTAILLGGLGTAVLQRITSGPATAAWLMGALFLLALTVAAALRSRFYARHAGTGL